MVPFLTAPFADNVQCLPANVNRFPGVTGRRTRVTRDAARIATGRGGKSAASYSLGRRWDSGALCDGVRPKWPTDHPQSQRIQNSTSPDNPSPRNMRLIPLTPGAPHIIHGTHDTASFLGWILRHQDNRKELVPSVLDELDDPTIWPTPCPTTAPCPREGL
jgi:hypothetical protein